MGAFLTLLLLGVPLSVSAQESRYASDPQLLGAGARSLGVGNAFTAISDDATADYWNAAGLTQLTRGEAQAQHAEQFGGTVNHDILTLGIPTTYGAFGIGLTSVGVDGIAITNLEDPARPLTPGNRPIVSGTTGTSDYTLALGFARQVLQKLSVGGSLKFIWRNLAAGDGTGYGLDIGAHYIDGPWRLGLLLKDATRTRITFDSGAVDRIRPSLVTGIAYRRDFSQISGHLMLATSTIVIAGTSAAEKGQRLRIGAEYEHHKEIAGRIGVEGDHFTAGAGLEPIEQIRIDIAFLENGDLDNTYRISASLYF